MALTPVTTLAFLTILSLGFTIADANAFLKPHASHMEERMSEEEVQTSLLAEVEGTFGEGTASSRLKQLETALGPIYAALPKNDKGYLGHSTVRYALHRLFVQRHGWLIKGLDSAGGHRNATSNAGLLKEQVPAYIQDLFEQRLGGRGFGLHELAVLAATIEHLVHSEAIKRLGNAFKVHNFLPTSVMSYNDADDVLDTYMASYILGEDLSNMSLTEALELKADMPEVYMAWNETIGFVRATLRDCIQSDGTPEQRASGVLDFSLVARAAERVGERFGSFQDQECKQLKASLLDMEESGTGRVRLSDFYKPAIGGQWQFQESAAYLRQLGALDEVDPEKPRVIIANYINSPSNCIASSSFYSVCCMDECEGLLGHLEQQIALPDATTHQIATIVSTLTSSTVTAPRALPQALLDRLGAIAAHHGGTVPLHGRLFSQWMHHAFPRECPFPHISGTTNPQTPDEWLASTGEETTATDEEMQIHVDRSDADTSFPSNSTTEEQAILEALPWSPEEELLFVKPVKTKSFSKLGNFVLFTLLASIAYGLKKSFLASSVSTGKSNVEKFMV